MATSVALIVDCNACAWGETAEKHGESTFLTLMKAVQAFCNAHLSIAVGNELVVIGSGSAIGPRELFASRIADSPDASTLLRRNLRRALRQSAENAAEQGKRTTPLARPFAHALCHLRRAATQNAPTVSELDATSSSSPTAQQTSGRLIVLTLSDGASNEHAHLMNLFFSAQKMNVIVDVVTLRSSPLLQQAADITSGVYLELASPKQVLPALLTQILTSVAATSSAGGVSSSLLHQQLLFKQPTPVSVDYRAACVCHGKLVSMAWVCSACLSVLCTFTPICGACGAVFKIAALPRRPKKRKKDE